MSKLSLKIINAGYWSQLIYPFRSGKHTGISKLVLFDAYEGAVKKDVKDVH